MDIGLNSGLKNQLEHLLYLVKYIFSSKKTNDEREESPYEEIELNTKQKLMNVLYYARIDKKIEECTEKFGDWLYYVTSLNPIPWIGVGCSVLSLAVQIGIGQYYGNAPKPEKSLTGVFWWIPHLFSTIQGSLITFWGGFVLYTVVSTFELLFKLPRYKNRRRFKSMTEEYFGIIVMTIGSGFIVASNSFLLYAIKAITYSLLDCEMTSAQQYLNYVNYYFVSIPLWIASGVLLCVSQVNNFISKSNSTSTSLLSSEVIYPFLSFTLHRLNCGPVSVLPLSVALFSGLLGRTLSEKPIQYFDLSRFALSLSLAVFGLGHRSYFSFAPLTLSLLIETYRCFKEKREYRY